MHAQDVFRPYVEQQLGKGHRNYVVCENSELEYWSGSLTIKGVDALISSSMFVKSEKALADSTPSVISIIILNK